MLKVAMIFRKPQTYYFSIEKVFALVEPFLKNKISLQKAFVPRHKISLSTFIKNLRFVSKLKADVYHVTGDIHYTVFGLPTRKTILTIHDCVFMYQAHGLKRQILYYLFLKWPVKKSSLITTVSEKSREDIIRFTGCSPDKVVVVADSYDERITFQPHQFNKQRPVFLFVGITPNKNLFRVIEALEGIQCELHIIGKIPAAQREQLEKTKINYRESFNVSDEELRLAYAKADIVLFPSLFEGFGLPIIEAQQTGRAVITSNLSPMKEVAGSGACLIDPLSVKSIRDGIIKVMEETEYREHIIKQGLKNAELYKPDRIANSYLEIYQRIQAS